MMATINATVIETVTPTIAPVMFGFWTTATIIYVIPSHANNVNCEI